MSDPQEIAEGLRGGALSRPTTGKYMVEAADTIDSLLARIKALEAENERLRNWGDTNDRYINDMIALEHRAEAAEAKVKTLEEVVEAAIRKWLESDPWEHMELHNAARELEAALSRLQATGG